MESEKQVALPEGEYAKYLANLSADLVNRDVQRRETKWRAIAGLVFTAVAILGFVNFTSISDDLNASVGGVEKRLGERLATAEARLDARIEPEIRTSVQRYVTNNRTELVGPAIETLKEDLQTKIALLQLVISAAELKRGNGFTDEARGAVVDLLDVVGQNEALVQSKQFAKPLEDIVDAFLLADQELYIDDIDAKMRKVVSKRAGIASSMLQHYGLRVLGATSLDEADVERLLHYATVTSKSFKSPENSAPFLLGLDFLQAGGARTPKGEAIFQDAQHWKPKERANFVRVVHIVKEGQFSKVRTGKTQRVMAAMTRVYEAYKEEFAGIASKEASQEEAFRGLLEELRKAGAK